MDAELQADSDACVGEGMDERGKTQPRGCQWGDQVSRAGACRGVLAIGAALTAIASNASAQNCGQWGDVVAWQASYAFTGCGGGTTTDGMLVYTWTVNRQFTATATLTSYVSCGEV